jgi:hypothetical protein
MSNRVKVHAVARELARIVTKDEFELDFSSRNISRAQLDSKIFMSRAWTRSGSLELNSFAAPGLSLALTKPYGL